MTRILVTGSRNWTDAATIQNAILEAWRTLGSDPDAVVVHGAARGTDTLADAAARNLNLAVERHPADWTQHGKKAGPARNRHMVELGADLCLAFPIGTSAGTWNCVRLAEQAGIPVRIIRKTPNIPGNQGSP